MRRQGSYAYFSSRNNNLSNRNQKGRLCVGSTTFCEARTRPNREDEVSGARFHQIDQDRIDQTEDILQGETDPFMPWDNDILGDGDAAETEDGCQALRLEERSGSSSGMSSGSIAGVVIGVLLISLVVTLLVQYGVGAWRDRQAGAPIRSPYAHFCGSSSRRKPVQGSQPPAQHRHQRLDDSESSGDEAPRAPRKPIISWQTGNMSAQQQYSRGAAPQSRLPPTPETEMVEQGQAGKGSSAQRPAVQGVRPPPPPPGGQ